MKDLHQTAYHLWTQPSPPHLRNGSDRGILSASSNKVMQSVHALAHTHMHSHTHTRAHIQHTHTHTHTTFHTFPVFAVGVEFPVQNSVQLLNYFHDHNQLLPPTESDELRNTAGTSPAQPDLCDHTSLSYAGDCGYGQ